MSEQKKVKYSIQRLLTVGPNDFSICHNPHGLPVAIAAGKYGKDREACEEMIQRANAHPDLLARIEELEECVRGLVWQFGHRDVKDGKPVIHSGCLSDMEYAFQLIGWDDPHFLTEEEQDGSVCEVVGCVQPATCGSPWPDSGDGTTLYLRLCSKHYEGTRLHDPRPPIKQYALDREATRDPKTGVFARATLSKEGGVK